MDKQKPLTKDQIDQKIYGVASSSASFDYSIYSRDPSFFGATGPTGPAGPSFEHIFHGNPSIEDIRNAETVGYGSINNNDSSYSRSLQSKNRPK